MDFNPSTYKRIAFVSNNAWSVYNFRWDVIQYLIKNQFEVLVIAPDDDFSHRLTDIGCQFIPIHFDNKAANPLADIRFYRELKQLYKKWKPDFIFHYVVKPNIYGSLAAASLGIPSVAVVTGLGYAFAKKNWLNTVVKNLYKFGLKKTREVWFLNNDDARIFINEKLIPIEKAKVLPGEGVNTNFFKQGSLPHTKKKQPFTFLMSTRLLRSKGIAIYADAARILKNKNYDFNCVLIGFFEKNHPDSIHQEELDKWQKEGLIKYEGYTDHVKAYLEKADCFVFPSFYNEGVPRSLMEAASMELPIITAQNRGSKEVVQHELNGFICNSNDPFDLADKMERMLNLPETALMEMGSAGRKLVKQKFDVRLIIQEYLHTLNKEWID